MKLGEIIRPLEKLLEDALSAEEQLEKHDTQFSRRAYVRSVFAGMEGSIWLLKQACLRIVRDNKLKFLSLAECALLSDKSYELTDTGEPREQQKFLKLADNVRFTFRTLNRLFRSNVNLGVGGRDWGTFRAAIEIRNRLAHPKSGRDIDVSDAEIKAVRDACHWFNQLMHDCIEAMCPSGK